MQETWKHHTPLAVILGLLVWFSAAQAQTPLAPTFSASHERVTQQGGEAIYRSVCQACHMPDGAGAKSGAGFFPALRGNPKLAASGYPAVVVLNGLHGMQPFGPWLDDQQVADVVNFVRANFGNQYSDNITPQAVAQMRSAAK
jgi:mono/diheme cytochrome c family protein